MRKLILLILAMLIAAVSLSGPNKEYEIHTIKHRVTAGETVWDIAASYMGDQHKIRDIREMVWNIKMKNNLRDYRIQPGDMLEIPLWTEKK